MVAMFFDKSLASSTTKTGRHDIAEILLKVALKHQKIKRIYSVTSPDIASERVLLCAKWTILQLYNGMYKLYFGAMMIISACKIQTRLFGFA
jgi:hypothetical protein